MAARKRSGSETEVTPTPTRSPVDGVFVSKRGIEFERDFVAPPEKGKIYGRCGGRPLLSELEQRICQALSKHGLAHSHAPRRFEVKLEDNKVAAYSPTMVLRGRGREGKTMVIEVLPTLSEIQIKKIKAFRKLFEAEFYVTLVAPGPVLDEIFEKITDDEVLPSSIETLVARMAE
jgi:hypothetical protein